MTRRPWKTKEFTLADQQVGIRFQQGKLSLKEDGNRKTKNQPNPQHLGQNRGSSGLDNPPRTLGMDHQLLFRLARYHPNAF